MFDALGVGWGNSLLGFISLAFLLEDGVLSIQIREHITYIGEQILNDFLEDHGR
jgi:hypothetical protein